jgi:hypothetical protein
MKLSGRVRIEARDIDTGEITWTREKNNLIPNNTLLDILSWNSIFNYFGLNKRISISSQQTVPTPGNSTLTGVMATGYIPSGITSPTWNESVDPPFGQIQNRIDPTGTARTFQTVGLTALASANNSNTSGTTFAYVKMDTPCTQGASEVLDIFYRIQFDNFGGQGLPREARYDFGRGLFGVDGLANTNFRMSYLYAFPQLFNPIYNALNPTGFSVARVSGAANIWTSGTKINSHFKWKYALDKDRTFTVGTIYSLMAQGLTTGRNLGATGVDQTDRSWAYSSSKFAYNEEPFQTGFWHSASAPGPFFDSLFSGASNGMVYLSGAWQGLAPELYRINVIASGATGVATYNWSVRKHLGFDNNTYTDLGGIACPFINANISAAPGQHGWKAEDNDVLRFSRTQIIQYDRNGVTLLNVWNGEYTNWDSTTNPQLAVTDVRQCASDGIKIYVACRATGLWVIDTVANTVTQAATAPCYGVDVGRAGKAWAVLEGRLVNSDNFNTSVAFTFTGLTDGNWARCRFLKADPENANDQIGIVADNGSGVFRVIWKSNAATAGILGYSNVAVRPWPASMDVSDTGGFWALRATKLNYGVATVTALTGAMTGVSLTSTTYGTDTFHKVAFHQGNLIGNDRLISPTNTIVVSYTALGALSSIVHLDGGIVLTSKIMRQLFTDNSYCWENYGWNGSAWVLGGTGARATHTTEETLGNGIRVRFENGAAAPHFTASNYFTEGVNYGLLKDNITSVYYSSQWYSKPAQFDSTATGVIPAIEPYTLILPAASDPDFVRLETDSPDLHSFSIAGIPVVKIYNAGEAPGPGEVSLNPAGNGVLLFNMADAGKEFVAQKYCWIKN